MWIPCQVGHVFMTWQWLPSEQVMREKERERGEPKTEATVYYKLTLKVLYCHFGHILLVTQTNTGTVWEGTAHGYHHSEVGIIGRSSWRLAITNTNLSLMLYHKRITHFGQYRNKRFRGDQVLFYYMETVSVTTLIYTYPSRDLLWVY